MGRQAVCVCRGREGGMRGNNKVLQRSDSACARCRLFFPGHCYTHALGEGLAATAVSVSKALPCSRTWKGACCDLLLLLPTSTGEAAPEGGGTTGRGTFTACILFPLLLLLLLLLLGPAAATPAAWPVRLLAGLGRESVGPLRLSTTLVLLLLPLLAREVATSLLGACTLLPAGGPAALAGEVQQQPHWAPPRTTLARPLLFHATCSLAPVGRRPGNILVQDACAMGVQSAAAAAAAAAADRGCCGCCSGSWS
eukprot:506803-Pelagomonas_calceolata.AAC.2